MTAKVLKLTSKFPSATKYRLALASIRDKMTVNQLLLLQKHYLAKNHTATARQLATVLKYENWGGCNLQYGNLAKKLCQALGITFDGDRVWVLATFQKDKNIADGETQFVMRPQLAQALIELEWVW